MDFRQLESLVEVLEKGSISGAAASLGISQPAVSKHIARLEEEMGIKIFVRGQKCSKLTVEGEILYDFAKKVVSSLNDIKREVTNVSSEVAGTVTISASSIPGDFVLPSILVDFRRQYPYVNVEVYISDSREALERLVTKDTDIAVTGFSRNTSGLESYPLCEDELVLIVSPDHPLANRRAVTMKDVEDLDLIGRVPGSATRRIWEDAYKEHFGVEKEVGLSFGHVSAVVNAVESGGEGGIVSRLAVGKNTHLVTIPFSPALKRFFYITYGTVSTRAMKVLIDFLRERVLQIIGGVTRVD
ncbi:LysR family transcriptional regulator [Aminobacterium colombiense]|uniref:Transcriptional regulator, LysR family n=1 Tax=Aminobacterium colombiense (strain DSM 12261 / ALA-1) TaxID=572547 RepID=D5EDP8_AMICL|nr:LysR family transcriptional regulator [Aminobacterium colombiense]ADE56680.1 transcriptional regulator, LysR family [Aminobacterium colombiense DSM 12261]MDD2379234.1 LysR family transcriptional regulator [Aminobacterium colombiense]MDD3767805.1 LysR family transcriptional regulator [Aminobacterium colombiense]MDD4265545.1 LysR family transcriptional regulator [Aminobacterium colombiense]MDD4585951.1 LysR family transcriptional regulator [Aminobacterium colombiense]